MFADFVINIIITMLINSYKCSIT